MGKKQKSTDPDQAAGSVVNVVPLVLQPADRVGAADPTAEIYAYWSAAVRFYNEVLFDGQLSPVVITLVRSKRFCGYYMPRALENSKGWVVPEIALNPVFFALDEEDAHRTLVHELCHHWRETLGPVNAKGGRGAAGYHDRVWVRQMEAVGLVPSHTGRPGGRKTGYSVSDYTLSGGRFEAAYAELQRREFFIEWADHAGKVLAALAQAEPRVNEAALSEVGVPDPAAVHMPIRSTRKQDRVKFSCGCGLNAWAKPSARLLCGDCGLPFFPAGKR